jgi:hypothetical protein
LYNRIKRSDKMIFKKIVLCVVVLSYLFSGTNYAYAQFWKNWFQKDKQAEEPVSSNKSESITQEDNKKPLPADEYQAPVEAEKGVDVKIWTIGEPKNTSEQAQKDAEKKSQEKAKSLQGQETATQSVDAKQKEEELKRTQEQVDQIKKLQEMNNIQRSLDNIRRINEMNQQQKRIDEINRLNKIQKNLDELRRMSETKK